MHKVGMLLLGAALTTSAQAAEPIGPATVRTNMVYTFARPACPKAAELKAKFHRDTLPFLDNVADRSHMTNEERSLLVLMCFMYEEGRGRQDLQ